MAKVPNKQPKNTDKKSDRTHVQQYRDDIQKAEHDALRAEAKKRPDHPANKTKKQLEDDESFLNFYEAEEEKRARHRAEWPNR